MFSEFRPVVGFRWQDGVDPEAVKCPIYGERSSRAAENKGRGHIDNWLSVGQCDHPSALTLALGRGGGRVDGIDRFTGG